MKRMITYVLVGLLVAAPISHLGCRTSAGETREPPQVDLRDLEEPPEKTDGRVIPFPPSGELTAEQKRILRELGVPVDGYVFPAEKAKAAAELRVYAESLYADAMYNRQVERMVRESMWERLRELSERVDEQNTWWQRHRGQIGFVGGWVVGGATVLLVVHGVDTATD